ncbi:unnamed protein product [Heligmosomoides polygyrus]|uniref:IF rod domain-containing protein n=1 Tax=Heligmosomoides polygyrus TaxID=6339 RepID=A0A183F964_HELPZ|nr:unnamed protein product [Heligmosomoides polygyrus]
MLENDALENLQSGQQSTMEKFNNEVHESAEDARNAVVIRIDEVEHEVQNIQSEVLNDRYRAVLVEIRERERGIGAFKEEISGKLKALEKKMELLRDETFFR